MKNIFEIITNKLPGPTEQQAQQLKDLEQPPASPVKLPTKQLISEWKKNESPEVTAELLKRMQPTINSAMTSYAPGMDKSLSVKAAKLTLDALRTYDASYGTDPSTHVFHTLKRLNRLSSQRANIIPQSEYQSTATAMLRQLSDKFIDEKGREPSNAELADLSGFSTKKIDSLLSGNTVVSESSTLSEDSQHSTFATKDLSDEDYFEYVYTSVSPIDQKIMEWSSGLHGKPLLSNNQIAQRLKVSPAAVSQRKQRIHQLMSEVRGLV